MTTRRARARFPPELTALVDQRLTDAACAGHAPLFDAHIDDETDAEREYRHHRARAICARCPVATTCATVATEHQAPGIWAGHHKEESP